jgi:hypothetical protein
MMIVEKIDTLLNEINKKQFEDEIDKAKGNKKELDTLSKTLSTLTDLLPQQYIDFLKKKIEKAK